MWPVLARYTADPIFALFFEAKRAGRRSAGALRHSGAPVDQRPDRLGCGIMMGTAKQRRTEAEAAIEVIDGLLLRRVCGSSAASGIRTSDERSTVRPLRFSIHYHPPETTSRRVDHR